jgi:adenylate kinase family enzyme
MSVLIGSGRLALVDRPFIVMTGLPGSGKTTLGRRLATRMGLAMLDKDDILDALLDSLGAPDAAERQRLSRAADAVLQTIASNSPGAVLASFWCHERLSTTSGTPWRWLPQLTDARLVEVHCVCPPALAVERFLTRRRHPGHHDERHSHEQLTAQFETLAAEGPLGIGPLVPAPTSGPTDLLQITTDVEQQLGVTPRL